MDLIDGLISRLRNRVDSMIARAVIGRVNDALKTQRLQLTILDGEVEDNVEHLQPFGLSFTPPEGAEALALAIAGDRSHTVAICANAPGSRPKENSDPETGGLYSKGEWRVFVDKDLVVHIGAQSGAQFIALAQKVLDELNKFKQDLDGVKNTYDNHVHVVTGSSVSGGAVTASAQAPVAKIATPHTPESVAAEKAKAT